jgi:hypothetical protein
MGMPKQFDKLRYAKRLESAGIPRAQADAQAEALGDVLTEFIVADDKSATSQREKFEIKYDRDMRILRWLCTTLMVLLVGLMVMI